jgi:hypothetical protein
MSGARSGSGTMPLRYPSGGCQGQRPFESAAFMPATVRSAFTSLSNCAKPASIVSMSRPVAVSSIGSVTLRNVVP